MKWTDGIVIVAMLAAGAVIGVFVEHAALPRDPSGDRVQWEILLTGLIALIAAKMTVDQIGMQIKEAREIEDDRRHRRERAARAMLPLALTQIRDYAKGSMKKLSKLAHLLQEDGTWDKRQEPEFRNLLWQLPPVPTDILSTFKDCIEFGDEVSAEGLRKLESEFRSISSRLERLVSGSGPGTDRATGRHEIDLHLAFLAELYVRAYNLEDFADGRPYALELDRHKIRHALCAGITEHSERDRVNLIAEKWQEMDDALANEN